MGDKLGGKLGTRIAEINTRAKLSMLHRSRGIIVGHGMALQEAFFELTGRELRETIGPFYRDMANTEGAPDSFKDTMNFLADGHGQFATLLAGATTSQLIGSGVGTVFTNWLQPLISANLRIDPNAILSVADAAAASIRGIDMGMDLASEAASNGLANNRFRVLEALASGTLDASSIMALLNREIITTRQAVALFKRIGWDADHSDFLFQLRNSLISVQEAAAMVNRDILTEDEARTIARHNGYTEQDMDKFNLLGGEPPDIESLMLAFRRGVIDEATLDRGIIEGPLRKEWIPVVKQLQFVPLPVEEAASAVNQGHMDLATATKVASLSGYTAADFAVIVDNAGRPPGPQEALSWLNRGSITEAQFTDMFLESTIKNKWVPFYIDNRHTLLTMVEIRSLFAKGAIPRDQALLRLQQRGYLPEDAGFILDGASKEKTAAVRDLTAAQIVQLHIDQMIDDTTALSRIQALGYDAQEAQYFLDLADARRTEQATNLAVSHIRSLYVGHHIEEGQASSALDALHIPPDARDALIATWTIERRLVTKELTTAEVIAAGKIKVLTSGQAYDKLQAQGYSPGDALIKLKVGKILTPAQTVEDLVWPTP